MSQIISKAQDRYLIIVDLDGTILNNDYATLNQRNKRTLTELQKNGHKICIATGRNYLSALPFYNEIGLDSFLITYNGAYINHPKKGKYLVFNPISNQTVSSILNEKIIKENLLNSMVDREDLITISTSEDIYYQQIFFNGNRYIKTDDLISELKGKDCLQLVLEFDNDEHLVNKVISNLRRKYHSSITFYCGNKLKAEKEGDTILVPDKSKMIIKIRNVFASKGMATEWASNYYNIPLTHTMAFGNDINDLEMMRKVSWGIAMSNSAINLKSHVRDITDFQIHNEGVADYLENYFGLEF